MPNWTANLIRFIGNRDDIVSVLKLVIVDNEYLENIKKDEFNLCSHVQSHPNYCDSDREVCEKCEHGKFCPLLSPKGADVTEWEMARVSEYGVHTGDFQEGDVYFGILIPQPRGMFQGGTNEDVAKRNARFGIEDWFDWNKEHWGTKWNPDRDNTTFEWLGDTEAELTFWTAWQFPEAWMKKLATECKKHNVEMEGEFADEDFGSCMGEFRMDDEEEEDLTIIYDSLNRDLYERVWGEGSLEGTGYDEDDE